MFNEDTELLFPLRVVPDLKKLRGHQWDELIDQVIQEDGERIRQKAFVLMMVRLGGCLTCNADSFRAMRGCTQCAQRTVRRIRETDEDLLRKFDAYHEEIQRYMENREKNQG